MNTRSVNSAAGVIMAALTQNRTAAGIALALESAGLLMSPETAAEVAGRQADIDLLTVQNAALEKRVAEVEASPLGWATGLDAKSLDNFLISLGQATEHEPMAEAIDRVHEIIRSFRAGLAEQQNEASYPAEGRRYWRAAEPDVRITVTRVWKREDADEPSVAFDIHGRDWQGRPRTSHSALRLALFRQLYRLDTTVPQPELTGGAS